MTRAGVFAGLVFLLGVGIVVALVLWRGIDNVAAVLATGGWALLWLVPWYALVLVFDAGAWAALLPRAARAPWRIYYATWVCDAVNWLLPVAQIGGEIVRIRLLRGMHWKTAQVIATVLVDKTLQAVTIALVGALAMVALVRHLGELPFGAAAAIFSLLLGAGIYVFYRLQRHGLFTQIVTHGQLVTRLRLDGLAAQAGEIDQAVRACYADTGMLARAAVVRLLNPVLLTGEVYLAMAMLGQPLGLFESFILQSLAQTMRSAAFLVPGGIGVQEGGVVVLALALGVPADLGLSLALVKRVRELLVGVPALLLWQAEEARGWLPGYLKAIPSEETVEKPSVRSKAGSDIRQQSNPPRSHDSRRT